MKQIFKVFLQDLRHIKMNVIALIVAVGICVVPSLYAWFNIAGSWDPYSSAKNIKIAVANTDQGYQGELIALKMNLGDQVVESLRANDQLDWQFTDQEEAEEGVRSGKYYAAIIIPESFSKDILSLFSDEAHAAEIRYCINEKDNAIAPKVTDKGATAVQEKINSVFVAKVSEIALSSLETVYQTTNQTGHENLAVNLNQNLSKLSSEMGMIVETMRSFKNLSDSSGKVIASTSDFLGETADSAVENAKILDDTKNLADQSEAAFMKAAQGIDTALEKTGNSYDKISEIIDGAFTNSAGHASDSAASFETLAGKLQPSIDHYTEIQNELKQLSEKLPGSDLVLQPVIGKLESVIGTQKNLQGKMNETAQKIRDGSAQTESDHQAIKKLLDEGRQSIKDARNDYQENLKPQISALFDSLDQTGTAVRPLLNNFDDALQQIQGIADAASSDLERAGTLLGQSADQLDQAKSRIDEVNAQVQKAVETGDLSVIEEILKSDATELSSFLASPVDLDRQVIYPVANYGSAMAPFYTTLAIWVGGVILAAMMRTDVSEKMEREMGLKPYQAYFGRYMTFLFLGLIQSTIVMLGDLYFLEIQCEHPFLMLLAGWVTSMVYVNLIYTLTISFGDVGKAIAVVLMVVQVAGSGGSFPIEVLPRFFQILYPLMPFAHSMAAMRECIAGMYHHVYWTELLFLLMFLMPSLLLGLVLRKPVMGLNKKFKERLEDTHLM